MVYLVTYDLNKETKRPPIVEEVKKFANWAKLSESSYAINTNLSVHQVHEQFKPHIDNNDQIYIINLKNPWAGFGPKTVNEWLDNNLPN